MKILIILSVIILMLSDYFLTIKSIGLAKNKYREYFQIEKYELNPVWQKSPSELKLFNIKYISIVILSASILYYLITEYNYGKFTFFCLGIIIISYAIIVSNHISNILIFKFVKDNPYVLQGRIAMHNLYLLKIKQYQIISITFLLLFIYIYTMSFFVLGGILGCIAKYIFFNFLIRRSIATI